ncbi:MAG: helix-turn-helix transcriptional regulator [Bacillota bacterium]|nr:helix-turn-helix transcriptional regulator [Bacillota bacterium]
MVRTNPFKRLRIKADIESIQEAKDALQISQSMLYGIESGKKVPGRDLCLAMAKIYKCTIEEVYKAVEHNKKAGKVS